MDKVILFCWICVCMYELFQGVRGMWKRKKRKEEDERRIQEKIAAMVPTGVGLIQNLPSGTMETSLAYADNEISVAKLEIYLSPHDWFEIQEKSFYRELVQYLDSLRNAR